jgi:hypothetical protein
MSTRRRVPICPGQAGRPANLITEFKAHVEHLAKVRIAVVPRPNQ